MLASKSLIRLFALALGFPDVVFTGVILSGVSFFISSDLPLPRLVDRTSTGVSVFFAEVEARFVTGVSEPELLDFVADLFFLKIKKLLILVFFTITKKLI